MNLQHFVSEAALYAILTLQISCACVSDSEFRHEAGKWIILIATLTVIWNMAICVKIGVHQVKLLKQRKQNISKVSAANLVKDFRFSLDTKQESQEATTQQDQQKAAPVKKHALASQLLKDNREHKEKEKFEQLKNLHKAQNLTYTQIALKKKASLTKG